MTKLVRRFTTIFLFAILTAVSAASIFAQTDRPPKPAAPKPTPTPTTKGIQKPTTAEQVIATSQIVYSGGGAPLDQIRKTTSERGRSMITTADGKVEQSSYQRFSIRGESLEKERIRLDQEFPTAKFSLVFNDAKIVGIYDNTVFTPREDAVKSFENQLFHGLDAFLRYTTADYKAELADSQKIYGVEFYVVDITDKQNRKTRYFVSARTYRVMMLTYEEAGVKYRRKFYDYNYAQGTLVPFRSVLWANEKQIEETEIGTVTYGQKVDEELFKAS